LLFSLLLAAVVACPPADSFIVLGDGTVRGNAPQWLLAHNNTRRLTKRDLSERWLHIIPPAQTPNIAQSSNRFGETWAGNTVPYCFGAAVSADNQVIFRRDLAAAWNSWIAAGVDSRTINFREGTPSECTDNNRRNYLEVAYAAGTLVTTLGNDGQSTMTLDTDPTIGLGDRVANYAHEIGQ